jgi:hypothetical protein
MAVFKRPGISTYSYDFRFDGNRYSGATGVADIEAARRIEQQVRNELYSASAGFCKAIINRAKTRLPDKASAKSGYVYMIRNGFFIKIGHSHDPAERVRSINTASPDGCELLFWFRGSQKLERQIHKEFAACHYKKEWFFLCGKLKQFVEDFETARAQAGAQGITQKSHAGLISAA